MKKKFSDNYVPRHGTKDGYDWHKRGAFNEPCEPCRDAMKAYWVWRRKYHGPRPSYRKYKAGARRDKYTAVDVINIYGYNCHICGEPIDMDAPRRCGKPGWERGLHLDHVIPISKGGEDTLDNIRPSHGQCNIIKLNRIIEYTPNVDHE